MLVRTCNECLPFRFLVREDLKEFSKEFDKSEEDLKSLQSGVGQIVGEVLRQLTEDKCEWVWLNVGVGVVFVMDVVCMCAVIVKASNGPRYVVGCRRQVHKHVFLIRAHCILTLCSL